MRDARRLSKDPRANGDAGRTGRRCARRGQCGFTFIEIMVALAIMAGVVVTVMASMGLHLGYVARDDDTTRAIIELRSRYESARADAPSKDSAGRAGFEWRHEASATSFVGVSRAVIYIGAGGASLRLVTYEAD